MLVGGGGERFLKNEALSFFQVGTQFVFCDTECLSDWKLRCNFALKFV